MKKMVRNKIQKETKKPSGCLDMVPNKTIPQTGNYTIYTISIMIGLALAGWVGFKIKSKINKSNIEARN